MTIKQTIFIITLLAVTSGLFIAPTVSAGCAGVETSIINCDDSSPAFVCEDGTDRFEGVTPPDSPKNEQEAKELADWHANFKQEYGHSYGVCKNGEAPVQSNNASINGIYQLLIMGINILSAGIMIAAIGGFIYSAALYTTAGGNAESIKKAKSNMVNIVIGILAYALMYSFLNYLIPGGFLNSLGNSGVKDTHIAVNEELMV